MPVGPVYGTATPCRHATWPGAQPAVRWWLSHTYVYMSGVSLGRLLTHPLPDRQQGTDRAWGPRPHLLPQPDVQGGAEKLRAEEALHRGGSLEAEARLGLALCRAPASRLGCSASLTGSWVELMGPRDSPCSQECWCHSHGPPTQPSTLPPPWLSPSPGRLPLSIPSPNSGGGEGRGEVGGES